MYILAIETTGPKGSVALQNLQGPQELQDPQDLQARGQDQAAAAPAPAGRQDQAAAPAPARPGRIYQKITDEPMGHLRNLMAMAQELLAEAGASEAVAGPDDAACTPRLSPSDIDLVACSVGPGSYTGIRIGVSSARAIAQALNVPCVAVGSLNQFRLVAAHRGGPIAVIFNARRGQVYGAVFDVTTAMGSGQPTSKNLPHAREVVDVLPPGPYMLTDVLEKVQDLPDVVFYGDGVDAYQEQLEGYAIAPKEERYPTAELTLRTAMAAMEEDSAAGYEVLTPRYMRETEAEQKLKDGTLAKLREAKMAKFRSR